MYVALSNTGIDNSIAYGWTGDETMAGAGSVESTGDYTNDGARTFIVLDCATLTSP